jgi:hypothetical protein
MGGPHSFEPGVNILPENMEMDGSVFANPPDPMYILRVNYRIIH